MLGCDGRAIPFYSGSRTQRDCPHSKMRGNNRWHLNLFLRNSVSSVNERVPWHNEAMPSEHVSSIPDFLYGTAWKQDRTAGLTELAIRMGFRGIDTANQRRHYCEAGVGEGLAAAYRAGVVTRADIFLKPKFTHQRGQDHRLPYDQGAILS